MNENESHKTLTTQSILWVQWEGSWGGKHSVNFICWGFMCWPSFPQASHTCRLGNSRENFFFLFISVCLVENLFKLFRLLRLWKTYSQRWTRKNFVFIRSTSRIWKDFSVEEFSIRRLESWVEKVTRAKIMMKYSKFNKQKACLHADLVFALWKSSRLFHHWVKHKNFDWTCYKEHSKLFWFFGLNPKLILDFWIDWNAIMQI